MKDLHYISALKFLKAVAIVGVSVFLACLIFVRQVLDLHVRAKSFMDKLRMKAEQRQIMFKISLAEFIKSCR